MSCPRLCHVLARFMIPSTLLVIPPLSVTRESRVSSSWSNSDLRGMRSSIQEKMLSGGMRSSWKKCPLVPRNC